MQTTTKPKQATGKVTLTEQGNRLSVKFPFLPATINWVKTLHGRRWHAADRRWTADLSVQNIEALQRWGFTVDPVVEQFMATRFAIETVDLSTIMFRGELHPFQREGVQRIEALNGRALLGDEMGLGKTIQALAWLYMHPTRRPAVIVCPASIKLNWQREAERWLDPKETILIVNGTSEVLFNSASIIIINYDILSAHLERLPKAYVLIFDEAHAIKNRTAKRTKAAQSYAKHVQHVIALTGTPILNRPVEIFNAVNIVSPGVFPSFFSFAKQYCNAKHTYFGWDFTGASNIPELNLLLTRTCMIRRTKEEVLKDLPPKQRSFIPLSIDNTNEYESASEDYIQWLLDQGEIERAARASQAVHITRIEGLKQLAALGKLTSVSTWISEFLESGKKLVVFATHKGMLDHLEGDFAGRCVRLDGSTSQTARQEAVDKFQTDSSIVLFLGNIKAAGIGITLTAADSVAFVELPWAPGELSQAEDRVHRIGQESESVTIYYLLAAKTIEEKIGVMLERKARVLQQVLDGATVEESAMLNDIVKSYGGNL